MCRFRNAACWRSFSSYGLELSSVTVPELGGSSAPRMYSSVLLPLPDGPVIAIASPRDSVSEMPVKISSGPRGVGYDFLMSLAMSMWRSSTATPQPVAGGLPRHRSARRFPPSGRPCNAHELLRHRRRRAPPDV